MRPRPLPPGRANRLAGGGRGGENAAARAGREPRRAPCCGGALALPGGPALSQCSGGGGASRPASGSLATRRPGRDRRDPPPRDVDVTPACAFASALTSDAARPSPALQSRRIGAGCVCVCGGCVEVLHHARGVMPTTQAHK